MYVHLREREVEAVLRELLVDLLIHVIQHIPIVGDFGLGPDDEGHLAVVEALNSDHRPVVGLGNQRLEF